MRYILRSAIVLLFFLTSGRTHACSPLNTPGVANMVVTGYSIVVSFSNTSQWLNCPNVIDVEFACLNSNFSGFAVDTYTTPPQTFASSPYTYAPQSINIANLCPGSVYKIRIRERNNNSAVSSPWSATFTFTTPGVYVPPTAILSATPNLICPPAPLQLNANVLNNCGRSGVTYAWFPPGAVSNPAIANPVANISTPTTFTCIMTGGATGCWAIVSTLFINAGTGPPIAGTAAVTPSVLCEYNSATLTTTSFTGNIQWQSGTSANGPWTNIPGATSGTVVIPVVPSTTWFQAIITSCSGATVSSNIVSATTNTVPTLTMGPACTGTTSQLTFTYVGTSGTPTNVVWSPPPLALNAGSTVASYSTNGTYYALAFFGDGCIASSSINLVIPTASMNTSSVSCSSLGSATIYPSNVPGPYNLLWQPVVQTGSVAGSLYPGTHTCYITYNNGCQLVATGQLISATQLNGTVNASSSLVCPSVPSGTAAVQISNGSGLATYTWNTTSTAVTPSISGLGAGTHTVFVTDQITFCTYTHTFNIVSPPNFSLNISGSSTACVGSNVVMTAQNAGGTAPYTYTWSGGPTTAGYTVSSASQGLHVYTVTSTDVNGCTAMLTHGINFVQLPVVSVTSTSICPGSNGTLTASGASTYTWNNNPGSSGSVFVMNPNVATVYNVVGSSQSCSSSATGTMFMLPVPSPVFNSNSPICNGQNLNMSGSGGVTYAWSGPAGFSATGQNSQIIAATPNRSGTYVLVVTGANTCSASTTASLTVHPTPGLTAGGSTVCSNSTMNLSASSVPGASYLWIGPQGFSSSQQNPSVVNPAVPQSGNYTVVVSSPEGCTNTAVAHVTITQLPSPLVNSDSPKCSGLTANLFAMGAQAYQWAGPNGFGSTLQNPVINNVNALNAGTYTLTGITGPCWTQVTHNYVVNPLPVVTASNNGPVCETKTISLFAITNGTMSAYAWNGPSFVSALANPRRYPASVFQSGDYTLTVTDGNGCQSSAITTVNVLHNPNVAAAGVTVCTFGKAIMAASGAASYTWTGPNNYLSGSPNASVSPVTPSTTGVYTVLGQAVNGCTNISSATLGILPLPVPSLTVSPSNTLCLDGVVSMEGSGGTGYQWTGPNDVSFKTSKVSFSINKLDLAGIYTLVVTDNNGCSSSTSTRLYLFPNPEGALNGLMEGCAPLCSDYKFSPAENNRKISASWKVGQKVMPQNFYDCFNFPGTYSVTGMFYDSLTKCSTSKLFYVNVISKPEADFVVNPANPIELIDEVQITNQSKGNGLSEYTWYITGGPASGEPDVYTSRNVSHTFPNSGLYSIVLVSTTEDGCTDTLHKTIDVQPDFFVYVPTVFTPNSDRLNDLFFPVTRGVKFYDLQIFNRWGQLVYSGTEKSPGWDGKDCKSDVYTWRLSVSGIHGERKEMKGHVTIYR